MIALTSQRTVRRLSRVSALLSISLAAVLGVSSSPLAERSETLQAAVPAGSSTSLVQVGVQVPAGMARPPFDVPRTLLVPRQFTISVYARIPDARFMAVTPDGNLLVASTGNGKIVLVRGRGAGAPAVTDFMTGLNQPQGLAFHTVGSTTYLYIGEAGQVDRVAWHPGERRAGREQVLLNNLPYGPTADGDTHPLKDLAFSPDGHLYVGFG
jgi:glucose/arabinose dehydrogenase